MRLGLNQLVERLNFLHLSSGTEVPVHKSAHLPEAFAIRCQHENLVPAHEIAGHRQHRAIRIFRATLLEQVDGSVERAENDNTLAKGTDRRDIT